MTAAPAVILLTMITPEADLSSLDVTTCDNVVTRCLDTCYSQQTDHWGQCISLTAMFICHSHVSHVTGRPLYEEGTEAGVTEGRGKSVFHKTSLSLTLHWVWVT